MYMIKVLEDLLCSQIVQTGDSALDISFHGESLSRAGLPICKTGYFCSQESAVDQRLDALSIYFFIVGILVKSVIEIKGGFLDVLGQINFLST